MLNYWLALAIFVLTVVVGKAFILLFDKLGKKNCTSVHKKVVQKLENHIMLVFVFLGIYWGIKLVYVWNFFTLAVFKSILTIVIFTTFSLILENYTHEWMKYLIEVHRLEINTQNVLVFRKFLRFLAIVLCMISLLWIWRIDQMSILRTLDIINTNIILRTVVIFVAYLILAKVVVSICKKYLEGMLRFKEGIADEILQKIEVAVSWIIVFYGLYFSIQLLGYIETLVLPIILTTIIFVVMHTIIVIVDTFLMDIEKTVKQEMTLLSTVHNLSKIIVIIFGLIFLLGVWGVNIQWILVFVAVVILVLGIVFRDVLLNTSTGLSLVVDGVIKPGQEIHLETGERGKIKEITFRAVKLSTKQGLVSVSHSRLAYMKITNARKH